MRELESLKRFAEARINLLRRLPKDYVCSSECHGTALWILGAINDELPRFVSRDEMAEVLKIKFFEVDKPRETDVATLWTRVQNQEKENYRLQHSAVVVHPGTERIYHQRDTLDVFEFSTINDYIEETFPWSMKRGKGIFTRFYRLF